jgi:hypothetical protein
MARELHHDSRFHVDLRFPQDRSSALRIHRTACSWRISPGGRPATSPVSG